MPMKYFKVSFLILVSFCTVGFTGNPFNYISTSDALKKYEGKLINNDFLAFPALREEPIKWFDSIPEGKIQNENYLKSFSINAKRGEFYVYQLGVWALKKDIKDVQIEFTALKDKSGHSINTNKMTCFNKGGIDFKGKSFSKRINVSAGRVQALWIGIDLDVAKEGIYTGSVSVIANGKRQVIPILLTISGEAIANHGYNEGKGLSRLNWLNSTVGIDEEVSKGYNPVTIEENTISIVGRKLKIATNGLPASITSYFDSSNQSFIEKGEPIVKNSFRFVVEKANGEIIQLTPGKLSFIKKTASKAVWKVVNTSKECDLECTGQMEFDGFVGYSLKLKAKIPLQIKDIRLEIPVVKEKSQYIMGLGQEGGYRKADLKWKWDVSKNQDMLWIGAVNGGLRVKWKAENYRRPLVNIYYEFDPLNMPPSWSNNGKGGVNVGQQNEDIVLNAYSGSRQMKVGEKLNYDFELLITPFKLIDRQNKFEERYYHGGGTNTSVKIENAKKAGANIINIHHAEDIYPFINYPYLDDNVDALTKLVADAHKENMRMKFYYTTRELTKNLPEFWAFNSLNGEVIFPGPGNASRTEALHPKGPNEWLIKNMREKYIPAWYNPVKEGKFKGETDLSVITTPDSRLNNFYIAGLDWMVQNIGIDGVYIDDSALDRFTLLRARKIIDKYRPNGKMDLHSWNHFHKWAGYTNCLNLYMDLLPYFDLVWIGEARDYNRLPDHSLIEVSGIPFGLPGQMLEGGGNPWRGMVYGITNRAGWTGNNSPSEMWKFWDEHHIEKKMMIGYWDKESPVSINNSLVKASIYKDKEETIISVANWTEKDQDVSIVIDWSKLGIDPTKSEIIIPEIKDFQKEQKITSLDKITIPGKKGYLILLKNKK